jgi:lipoprotein-releasing system permease protein
MTLASLMAPLKAAKPEGVLELAGNLWTAIGLYGRIAVITVALALAAYLLVLLVRRLSRVGGKKLLFVAAAFGFVALIGLGFWSLRLPQPRGSYFVLWHQIVRVGAAVGGTLFVVSGMGLLLPALLNRLEGRSFVSLVATRHVRASKSGFLTVISFLSIAGVALSCIALCVVVSIMGGFGADLKRKILGNNAHVKIEARDAAGFEYWRDLLNETRLATGVHAATPVVGGEAMASSSSNTAGVMVRGVDPTSIGSVIDLVKNIEVGKFEYITKPDALAKLPPDEAIGLGPGGEVYLKGPEVKSYLSPDLDPEVKKAIAPSDVYPGIVLGRELAKSLHVYVGDELTLVSPLGDLGPMGVLPRSRRFRVAAIFYSGMYEYDASHAYMLLETAQEFLDLGPRVTAIEVRTETAEGVTEVRPRLEGLIAGRSDLRLRDWKEANRNLFSALKLEKIATFIILSIAIAVASFCIICTLLLMVTEKSKEIAILKSLGASDRSILRIFMSEGILIGGVGTVLGVATGLCLMAGLQWFGVRLDPDVYYVDRLPISVEWLDYTFVALAAMVITTIATIYPALSASRLRPVDGIRYE